MAQRWVLHHPTLQIWQERSGRLSITCPESQWLCALQVDTGETQWQKGKSTLWPWVTWGWHGEAQVRRGRLFLSSLQPHPSLSKTSAQDKQPTASKLYDSGQGPTWLPFWKRLHPIWWFHWSDWRALHRSGVLNQNRPEVETKGVTTIIQTRHGLWRPGSKPKPSTKAPIGLLPT